MTGLWCCLAPVHCHESCQLPSTGKQVHCTWMRLHFPTEAISDMNSLGSRTSSRPVQRQFKRYILSHDGAVVYWDLNVSSGSTPRALCTAGTLLC